MTPFSTPDADLERRLARRLLDVLIRATLLLAMALLCYRVLAPFLSIAIWALIFAVTLYPLHLRIAAQLGGRPGLSATLLVLLGIALLVVPIAMLMSSLGNSVRSLIEAVQHNTLQIPAPPETVAALPVIGGKLHAVWSQAHDDLPAFVQSMQPKIGDLARTALGFIASIGGGLLAFLGALILAGIFMAFGEHGARACLSVFERLAGKSARGQPRPALYCDRPCRRTGRGGCGTDPGDPRRPRPPHRGIPWPACSPQWFWCLASPRFLR